MTEQALLYLAGPEDLQVAQLPVVGRPLGFRAVMAVIRAGVRRVGLPSSFRGTPTARAIAANPSARAAAWWMEEAVGPPPGPALLVPAGALVAPSLLAGLAAAPVPSVLGVSAAAGAPVVSASAEVARALWPRLATARPIADVLCRDLAGATITTIPGWYLRVGTPAAVPQADRQLWSSLGSAIDTRLDTVFHRRCSRPLSRLAVALGITPNQVSLASLGVGLAAAWCVSRATPAAAGAGLLLYALAVVLDHSDGEVARLTLAESRLGEWLDVAVDTVVHALLVAAMGLAAAAVTGQGAGLGALAALGIVGSAVLARISPVTTTGRLGRVLDGLGTRDGFYALLIGFILALGLWPASLPALMVVVAAGAHGYWLGRAAYRLVPRNTARNPK